MTIRTMLYAVLSALGLLILVLSGLGGTGALQDWRAANMAYKTNLAADLLLSAGRDIVTRRDDAVLGAGAGHGAMGAMSMKAQEASSGRGDHGGHGGDAFGQAMERLHSQQDWSGRSDLMDRLHKAMDRFSLQASLKDRDMAALGQDADALLAGMEELRLASVRMAADGDATAGTYSMMKHFSYVILDFASRERLLMAGFIADDLPVPPGKLPELFAWRGRVELAWQALEEAAASGLGGNEVAIASAQVRRGFFGSHQKLRRDVLEAGMTGQSYGIAAADWLDRSGRAVAGIVELQKAIVTANEHHAADQANLALRNMILYGLLLAAGFTIGVFSLILVARRISGPIKKMTLAMTRLADGDTDIALPAADRGDEIGLMAKAVLVFRDNAVDKQRLEAEQEAAREQAKKERSELMSQLFQEFDQDVAGVVDHVTAAAAQLEQTAQSMSALAEQATGQAGTVATASNQASANVQTVATAAEEMSASIAEIGRQVAQASRITASAVDQAEATNATVKGLADSASRIGEVVNLINDIAGQTNLLALNATIEAARAGEAGKGFAVVAQEVKNLANQTAKATEEISAQVGSVQDETKSAVEAIGKIQNTILEVSDISTTIASAIEEQANSTQEIARNVQEAARGSQDVNANIADVGKAVEETGAASGQVLGAAGELSRQAGSLRQQVDSFLGNVRVA